MSEVVKKLVTELGFILKDQDKLKKYSDTAKTLVKTQKESNKVQAKGKDILKETDDLFKKYNDSKKKDLDQTAKNLTKIFNDLDKQSKTVNKNVSKATTDNKKQYSDFQKNLNAGLKNIEAQEKKRVKIRETTLKQLKAVTKQGEDAIVKHQTARQMVLNVLQGEHNKILKERATLEKSNLKTSLENDIAKAQARQKEYADNQRVLLQQKQQLRNDIEARNQARLKAQDTKMRLEGSVGGRFALGGGGTFRPVPQPKVKPVNAPFAPKGISFPTPGKQGIDKEVLGQTAVDVGTRIADKTQQIVMSSIDIMLEYEKRLNELQVRGELNPQQLKDIDQAVQKSSQTWGSDLLSTQKIGIELAKSGLQGDMLKFMIEESTMLGRSFGSDPVQAMGILNAVLHQQGKNIQSPTAIKKGIPVTQDKEAIKKVSNMLSAAVNLSMLDPTSLEYYMKYSGTGAGSKGIDFEEWLYNAMIYSNVKLMGSTPGTSQRKITTNLYQGLSDVFETQNFKVGKKKGKKGSKLEKAYDLRDFVSKDISKYIGKDKLGRKYFRQELALADLVAGMKKKKLTDPQQAALLQEIGGLTASEALDVLTRTRSPEEKKQRQKLKEANKRDETRRTATGLMQNPKSKLEQTTQKKNIAMVKLGREFTPEVGLFTQASNYLLDKFNSTPSLRKTGKRSAYMSMGSGIGAGFGGLLGSIFMGPGMGTVLGAGGGMLLGVQVGAMLHDTIAVINKYKPSIGTALNGITSLFKSLSDNTKPYIDSIALSFTNLINKVAEFMGLPTTKTFDVKINGGGRNFGFTGLPSSSSSEKPLSKAIVNVNRSLVVKGAK